MRGWRALVIALGGCYHPSFATDVPCTADLQCPGSQICDLRQSPPLCVSQLGSDGGGSDDFDAGVAAPDAPAFCSTCNGTTPVCVNGASCRACASDNDCGSHVCEELTGQCYPTAETLFVRTTGSDANACTHDAPCANVSRAIQLVDATHPIIRIYDGNYDDAWVTTQSFILSGEGNADKTATITWKSLGHDHLIEVDGGTAIVEGVTLVGAATETIRATGLMTNLTLSNVELYGSPLGSISSLAATVTLSRLYMHSNMGGTEAAVSMTSGQLTMKRSVIFGIVGSCVRLNATKFVIENSFFTGCTGDALTVIGSAVNPMIYNFNTAAYNTAGVNTVPAVTATSSILAYNTDGATPNELAGAAQANYSLFTDDAPSTGTGNVTGDPLFVNSNQDLHIQAMSAARDRGDPNSNVTIDYDGDTRPHGNGFDIGADEH